MSEFSFPLIATNSSKKTMYWHSVVMSELSIFCSFILSHPLYFSYLIFVSPYIIKICSFLSPLFITTSLLLLALLTTINVNEYNSEKYSKISFLLSKLVFGIAEEENKDYFQQFEEFEAYKLIFETLQLQGWTETEEESDINGFSMAEPPPEYVDKHLCHEISNCTFCVTAFQVVNEICLAEIMRAESESESEIVGVGKSLGGFFREEGDENDFINVSCEKGSKKEVKTQILSVEFNKVEEEQKAATEAEFSMQSSESGETAAIFGSKIINSEEGKMKNRPTDSFSDREFRWKNNIENNSENSMGSMRKEKEWRRTLACKLFEERHNSNIEATEGMDLLWETYEESSIDHHSNKKQQLLTKSKTKKFSSKYHNDDDYEEEEEEMDDGQLCCLQALKFSAGKMNLGMGRPNLMKISKTFKGIGWLHNLTKHGKKIHH